MDRTDLGPGENVDDEDIAVCRRTLETSSSVVVFLHEDSGDFFEESSSTGDHGGQHDDLTNSHASRTHRLRFQSVLGAGGFGVVFAVTDVDSGQSYAMKMLRPSLRSSRQHRARFLREAELTAEFRHPGIVRVVGRGMLASYPFILTELVSGGSLSRRLQERGVFEDLSSAVRIVIRVCDAVRYAHENGLLHRDLKPENILLKGDSPVDDPEVVVTDFGLARLLNPQNHAGTSDFSEHVLIGSIRYMAPEAVMGHRDAIGVTADVFSLAAILYQMVTGQVPFEGHTYFEIISRMITGPVAPARRHRSHIPRDVELILQKALQRKVTDRYQSVAEFSDDLQRYLDGKAVLARQSRVSGLFKTLLNEHPNLVGATLVLAVMLPLALVIITSLYLSERHTRIQNRELMQATMESVRNYTNLAEDLFQKVPASARKRYELHLAALRAQEQVARILDYNAESRYRLSIQYSYLASAAGQLSNADLASEYRTKCLQMLTELLEEDPDHIEYQYDLFYNRKLLADENPSLSGSERLRLKEDVLRDIVRLRVLAPDDPDFADAEASCWYGVAQECLVQKSRECESSFRNAIRISDDLWTRYPEKLVYVKYALLGRAGLSDAYRVRNELAEAEKSGREAVQRLENLEHPEKEEVWFAFIAKEPYRAYASALTHQGKWDDAVEVWSKCVSLNDLLHQNHPTSPLDLLERAIAFAEYFRACRKVGLAKEAEGKMRDEALLRLQAVQAVNYSPEKLPRIQMVIDDPNAPPIDAVP
ncbi:MAG: protein kinase domain-containing protein [Planctomycetota bacterium]